MNEFTLAGPEHIKSSGRIRMFIKISLFLDPVINRVVQRSPLLFKNKMIQVALVSTQQQQEEEKEEMKTVEIRGLNSEGETEMCIYYFENPSKGGGDIENSEWNEEDKIFFITFCDPKGVCFSSFYSSASPNVLAILF